VEQYTQDPTIPFVVLVHVGKDSLGLYSTNPIGLTDYTLAVRDMFVVEYLELTWLSRGRRTWQLRGLGADRLRFHRRSVGHWRGSEANRGMVFGLGR
jgi:hypothetical protein